MDPMLHYSETEPVTRGQWRLIARRACDLLGVPEPTTQLEASVVIARIHLAAQSESAPPPAQAIGEQRF